MVKNITENLHAVCDRQLNMAREVSWNLGPVLTSCPNKEQTYQYLTIAHVTPFEKELVEYANMNAFESGAVIKQIPKKEQLVQCKVSSFSTPQN